MTLIAGATITGCTSNCGPTTLPGGAAIPNGTSVNVSFTSAHSGDIDLTANNTIAAGQTLISTNGNAGQASGDVILVAYANGDNGGHVWLPITGATAINAEGNNAAPGNVLIVAGASSTSLSPAIQTGLIDTLNVGGNGGFSGGNIVAYTAQPTTYNSATGAYGGSMQFDSNGNPTNGVVLVPTTSSPVNASNMNFAGGITGGGYNFIAAGGNITLGGMNFGGPNQTILAGGNIASSAAGINIWGQPLNIVAGAAITPTVSVSSNGAPVTGANVTGASATGGNIDFATNAVNQIQSGPTPGQGFAGNINLIAFHGSTNAGTIKTPIGVTINSNTANSSEGGNVMIIAGAQSGQAISIGPVSTGSGFSNGFGNITIAAATPDIICAACASSTVSIPIDSVLSPSTGIFGAGTPQNASIAGSTLTSPEGFVQVVTNGGAGSITGITPNALCGGCFVQVTNGATAGATDITSIPGNYSNNSLSDVWIQTVGGGSITLNSSIQTTNSATLITDGNGIVTIPSNNIVKANSMIGIVTNQVVDNNTNGSSLQVSGGGNNLQNSSLQGYGVNNSIVIAGQASQDLSFKLPSGGNVTVQPNGGGALILDSSHNLVFDNGGGPGTLTMQNGSLVAVAGNLINIADSLATGGNGLTLIAGGDIKGGAPGISISSSQSFGSAGAMNIIAGASIQSSLATNNGMTTLQLKVSGASGTGGNIDFQTSAISSLSSAAGGSFNNGGNMNLIAFNNGGSGGKILVPTAVTISANAAGGQGLGGNILIVGGYSVGGTAISLGAVSATGNKGLGDITIDAAQVDMICTSCSGSNSVTIPLNGNLSVNTGIFGGSSAHPVGITVGTITSTYGLVQVYTGPGAGGQINGGAGANIVTGGPWSSYQSNGGGQDITITGSSGLTDLYAQSVNGHAITVSGNVNTSNSITLVSDPTPNINSITISNSNASNSLNTGNNLTLVSDLLYLQNGSNNGGGNADNVNLSVSQSKATITAMSSAGQGLTVEVASGLKSVVSSTNTASFLILPAPGQNLTFASDVAGSVGALKIGQGPISLLAAAGGNITIQSSILAPGDGLTLVAGGNISTLNNTGVQVRTDSTNSSVAGGALNLIAGASYSFDSSANTLTVTGASASGGSIDFTTSGSVAKLESNANGAGTNLPGGSINLIAYQSNGGSAGYISIPNTVTIDASGTGTGTGGNILVAAGGNNAGQAVGLGIVQSNGSGGLGDITIGAAQPDIICAGCSTTEVKIPATGITQVFTGIFAAGTATTGSVSVGNLTSPKGIIQVFNGGGSAPVVGTVTSCSGCYSALGNNTGGANITTPSDASWGNNSLTAVAIETVNGHNIVVGNNISTTNAAVLYTDNNGSVQVNSGFSVTSGNNIQVVSNNLILANPSPAVNLSVTGAGNPNTINISAVNNHDLQITLNAANTTYIMQTGILSGVVGTVVLGSSGNINLVGGGTLQISQGNLYGIAGQSYGIGDSITVPGNGLSLMAGDSITTTVNGLTISTTPASGDGGAINLIAGAQLSPGNNGFLVTVTGNGAGGDIDLTGGGTNNIAALTSAGAGNGAHGGDINLIAYNGQILLPTGVIVNASAGGTQTSWAGNVMVLSSDTSSASAISTGSITAVGAGGNGDITVANASIDLICAGCTNNSTYQINQVTVPANGVLDPVVSGIFAGGPLNGNNINIGAGGTGVLTSSLGIIQVYTMGTVAMGAPSSPNGLVVNIHNAAQNLITPAGFAGANISKLWVQGVDGASISVGNNMIASQSVTMVTTYEGNGSITRGGSSYIDAPVITLITGGGDIGSGPTPVLVQNSVSTPNTITLTTGHSTQGPVSVYIQAQSNSTVSLNPLSIAPSTADTSPNANYNTYSLVNTGGDVNGTAAGITMAGSLIANNPVTLSTQDPAVGHGSYNNGNISLGSNYVTSGDYGSGVTVAAGGSGNITQDAGNTNPTIESPVITLSSGTGSIGTVGRAITFQAFVNGASNVNLAANTSVAGNVYLQYWPSSGSVTVSQSSSSGNVFQLLSNDNIIVNSPITSGGTMIITGSGGTTTVGINNNLNAGSSTIDVTGPTVYVNIAVAGQSLQAGSAANSITLNGTGSGPGAVDIKSGAGGSTLSFNDPLLLSAGTGGVTIENGVTVQATAGAGHTATVNAATSFNLGTSGLSGATFSAVGLSGTVGSLIVNNGATLETTGGGNIAMSANLVSNNGTISSAGNMQFNPNSQNLQIDGAGGAFTALGNGGGAPGNAPIVFGISSDTHDIEFTSGTQLTLTATLGSGVGFEASNRTVTVDAGTNSTHTVLTFANGTSANVQSSSFNVASNGSTAGDTVLTFSAGSTLNGQVTNFNNYGTITGADNFSPSLINLVNNGSIGAGIINIQTALLGPTGGDGNTSNNMSISGTGSFTASGSGGGTPTGHAIGFNNPGPAVPGPGPGNDGSITFTSGSLTFTATNSNQGGVGISNTSGTNQLVQVDDGLSLTFTGSTSFNVNAQTFNLGTVSNSTASISMGAGGQVNLQYNPGGSPPASHATIYGSLTGTSGGFSVQSLSTFTNNGTVSNTSGGFSIQNVGTIVNGGTFGDTTGNLMLQNLTAFTNNTGGTVSASSGIIQINGVGTLTNSGTITSNTGSFFFSAPSGGTLTVLGNGGSFVAGGSDLACHCSMTFGNYSNSGVGQYGNISFGDGVNTVNLTFQGTGSTNGVNIGLHAGAGPGNVPQDITIFNKVTLTGVTDGSGKPTPMVFTADRIFIGNTASTNNNRSTQSSLLPLVQANSGALGSGDISLLTNSGATSGGPISIGGNVTVGGASGYLQIASNDTGAGNGNIIMTAGALTASTISLAVSNGTGGGAGTGLGYIGQNTAPITLNGTAVQANTTGNVYISDSSNSPVNLGGSQGSNFQFSSASSLNLVTGSGSYVSASNALTLDAQGDINTALNLASDNSGSIILVASGNITTSSPNLNIDSQSSVAGTSGAIVMTAGANFTVSSTDSSISISGASAGGGKVNLATNAISTLNSSASVNNTNGGSVTLVAFGGSTSGSGVVSLPSTLTVFTGGEGAGEKDGSVTIIAGGAIGGSAPPAGSTVISVGGINTSGTGVTGNGTINIYTAQPTLPNAPVVILNGNITSMTPAFAAGSIVDMSIASGTLTTNGSVVNLTAGNNALILGSINTDTSGTLAVINLSANTLGGASSFNLKPTESINGITGPVSMSNFSITGPSNVVLSGQTMTFGSNATFTLNPSSGSTETFTNSGTITSGVTGGGTSLSFVNNGAGTMVIDGTGTVNQNGAAPGQTLFQSVSDGSAIEFAATAHWTFGGTVVAGNGGPVQITSPNVQFDGNNAISSPAISANGIVNFNSPATDAGNKTLNIILGNTGGTSASATITTSGSGTNNPGDTAINFQNQDNPRNFILAGGPSTATSGTLNLQFTTPNVGAASIGWFNAASSSNATTINSGVTVSGNHSINVGHDLVVDGTLTTSGRDGLGNGLNIEALQVNLGPGATISTTNGAGANVLIDAVNTNLPALTISIPDGASSASISAANGGLIEFAPTGANTAVSFVNSNGVNPTGGTLLLSGGAVTINPTNSSGVSVGSFVTVSSNNTVTMNINGGTFTNDGTVRSTLASTGTQSIRVTSTGTLIWANDSGKSGILDPGSGNTVAFTAPTSLTLGNSLNQTISTNGGASTANLSIVTPLLIGTNDNSIATITLSNGSVVLNSGVSGGTIELKVGVGGTTTSFDINAIMISDLPFGANSDDALFKVDSGVTFANSLGSLSLAVTGLTNNGTVITGGNFLASDITALVNDGTISANGYIQVTILAGGTLTITGTTGVFSAAGNNGSTGSCCGINVYNAVSGGVGSSGNIVFGDGTANSLEFDAPQIALFSTLLGNQATGSITVDSGTTLSTAGAAPTSRMIFETTTFTNNGTVDIHNVAGSTIWVSGAGSGDTSSQALTIANSGLLSSASVEFDGLNVTANVTGTGSITGNVFGAAVGNTAGVNNGFSLTVANGDIKLLGAPLSIEVPGITSRNGDINITASNGSIRIDGTGSGAAPILIAGYGGTPSTYSQTSIYSAGALSTNGALTLNAPHGNININDTQAAVGPTLSSTGLSFTASNTGNDVTITAGGQINVYAGSSTNPSIVSAGGNILMISAGDSSITGGTFKATAQYLSGLPPVTIDGYTISAYTGGGLGIVANSTMTASQLRSILVSLQATRVYPYTINAPGWPSNTLASGATNGAYIDIPTGSYPGIGFTAGSGVMYIDPLVISGSTSLSSFGAPLLLPSPEDEGGGGGGGVGSTGGGVVIISPAVSGTGATSSATIITTDKTPPQIPPVQVLAGLPMQTLSVAPGQWYVSSASCTLYLAGELPGSQLQAQGGTAFRLGENRSVILRAGRMLAGAGKGGLTVVIDGSNKVVSFRGDTIAVIDAQSLPSIRVTVLAASAKDAVTVSSGKEQLASLASGEEALVADQAKEEELIPVDGCDRKVINSSLTKIGMRVTKSSVAVGKLLAKEPMLSCCFGSGQNVVGACQNSWIARRLHKLYGNPTEDDDRQISERQYAPISQLRALPAGLSTVDLMGASPRHDTYTSQSGEKWQPVSYVPAMAPPSCMHLGHNAKLIREPGNHYRLEAGSALVVADKATTVDTKYGAVTCKPGSIALVVARDAMVQVFNIHDRSQGDVTVTFAKHYRRLAPGAELSLVNAGNESAVKTVGGDGVGRRQTRMVEVSPGLQCVTDDFSLVHAMSSIPLLIDLRRSHNPVDRHLCATIMKMAAVLSVTTDRSRGSYSRASQ